MLKVLNTTDGKFEGAEFPLDINSLPDPFIIDEYVYDNFRVKDLGNDKYMIYNSNYIVIVKVI